MVLHLPSQATVKDSRLEKHSLPSVCVCVCVSGSKPLGPESDDHGSTIFSAAHPLYSMELSMVSLSCLQLHQGKHPRHDHSSWLCGIIGTHRGHHY